MYQNWKSSFKIILLIDGMILHVENPKEFTHILIEKKNRTKESLAK